MSSGVHLLMFWETVQSPCTWCTWIFYIVWHATHHSHCWTLVFTAQTGCVPLVTTACACVLNGSMSFVCGDEFVLNKEVVHFTIWLLSYCAPVWCVAYHCVSQSDKNLIAKQEMLFSSKTCCVRLCLVIAEFFVHSLLTVYGCYKSSTQGDFFCAAAVLAIATAQLLCDLRC